MAYVSDGIQRENKDSLSSTGKPIIHTHHYLCKDSPIKVLIKVVQVIPYRMLEIISAR